jgi:flagellar basal-body rod modification protein FlgD
MVLKGGREIMAALPINSISSSGADLMNAESRIPIRTLGQDDFLKLLVTQLSSQDPLNPQKDTDFIAQMAQFSSLEQAKAMEASLTALRTQQDFVKANAVLGREVELQIGKDQTVRGVVSAVFIEAGTPKIVVNDQAYDMNSLLSVSLVQPQPAGAAQLREFSLP